MLLDHASSLVPNSPEEQPTAFSLTWLPEVLRAAGLKVVEQPGWETRGRGEMGPVKGVMCHHTCGAMTGNMPSLGIVINGRPDLPGPLAQLCLGRDGTFFVVAAGRCNHAGVGSWQGLTSGNSNFIGIEAQNTGCTSGPRAEAWPEVQLDAYRRGVAAILKKVNADPIMCCGHKEYALPVGRKDDPTFDMDEFRFEVAAIMAGAAPRASIVPAVSSHTGKRPALEPVEGASGNSKSTPSPHVADLPGRKGFHRDYARRSQKAFRREDTPDFAFDPAASPYRASVRPYRKVTFRLAPETIGGKFVVHNYGHGGAGITMSWGCAEVVREIVTQHGTSGGVAVLGAGVMGLTVATLLGEIRPKINVTIYAEKFTPGTTSDIAGGQWAPSLVNFKADDNAARLAYFDVLRRARKAHERRIGSGFGVSRRWNYTPNRINHLDMLPTDIVPPVTKLYRLPFAKLTKPGFKYDLLLIEPPILMRKLQSDLVAAGVACVRKTFRTASDLGDLRESVIVNCTGLGSRDLFNDDLMVPVKGQLVYLRPQMNLNYLFSGDGHVFPRTDAVVIGGSEEPGTNNSDPDPVLCKKIVTRTKQLFDGSRF